MKIFAGLLLACLLLCGGVPSSALGARPTAAARMTACATALAPSQRYLVVEGSMRERGRASRMQMRFSLEVRTPQATGWRGLAAQGFGVWNTAGPTVQRYVYSKRVEALAAPADYRMVVEFRWREGGRVVAVKRRVTRPCRQPDLRPDLVVRRLAVKDARSGSRYVVRVANAGRSDAGPFSVGVWVNGAALAPRAVGALGAGGRTAIEVAGPACAPGSSVVVRVDPESRVDEREEGSNELVAPCPG